MNSNRPLARIQNKLFENVEKPLVNTSVSSSWLWGLLYTFLALLLIVLFFNIIYHWYSTQPDLPPLPQVDTSIPKGLSDMPRQMGAPISVEKGGDITENPMLNQTGVPGMPGWVPEDTTNAIPDQTYLGSMNSMADQGYLTDMSSGSMYASYPSRRQRERRQRFDPSDYYGGFSGMTRSQINDYITKENEYIRNVNHRVHQINRHRMLSPDYLKEKEALAEVREYERRLANRVDYDRQNEPDLQDQNPQ